MIIISVIATSVYNLIAFLNHNNQYAPVVSMNTLWICVALLCIEALHYWMNRWNDYIIIIGGAAIAFGLIFTFPTVSALLTILYLPILISIFYFQIRKVVFSYLVSLTCFYALYFLNLCYHDKYNVSDLIAMTSVLTVGAAAALAIMSRGSELMAHLRTSIASSQDLLIKNIIMDKLAKTDALTDLYNHMAFHEYLDKLIEQGEKYKFSFQLALLDIDHFKKVNDTYGHRAGDAVLTKVAQTMKEMVSLNDFPARYGGEEFAIIFTDMELGESLLNLENIRKRIEGMSHEELKGQSVTISIGVHDYKKGCSKEELFAGADSALYEAKRSGRNRTIVYRPPK
ncbi:GGDEF domain-containing protein [Paenibacillus rigui]|nr:GGDEF domain-containing protein [Paenibacillus rigui]